MDEELPYRSPVGGERAKPVSTQDETDHSTLIQVKRDFDEAIDSLSGFNTFDLVKDDTEAKVKDEIRARQIAYDILSPLQATLQSTLDDIKLMNEG